MCVCVEVVQEVVEYRLTAAEIHGLFMVKDFRVQACLASRCIDTLYEDESKTSPSLQGEGAGSVFRNGIESLGVLIPSKGWNVQCVSHCAAVVLVSDCIGE